MGELMITSLSVISSWSSLLQIITASENKLSRGICYRDFLSQSL